MKVRLLPLAIAAAIAAPGIALADGPTVYGKLNVTVDMVDVDAAGDADDYDQWEVNSWDSRLGVKGEEKFSDALTGFYTVEFGINVDDGGDNGSDELSQRNIFVGLKGGWGAVQLGKFDTPLKVAQGKIDQFGDTPGDIKFVVNGENRSSDLVQYTTPKFADAIVATIAIQPGEDECVDGEDPCDDGLADGFSAAVAYDQGGIYLAVAHDSAMASENPEASTFNHWDTTRVVGAIGVGMFEFGALYQMAEVTEDDAQGDADELDGFVLSGALKLDGANKIKLQYGASEYEDKDSIGGDETIDLTLLAIGFDHSLSKQTRLYTQYVMLEEEPEVGDSEEITYLQFGVDHKF